MPNGELCCLELVDVLLRLKESGELDFPTTNDDIKAIIFAYFITNAEPIKFWDFTSLILEGLGYGRPKIKIHVVMMPIAHMEELLYKLLAPYGMKVPQLTP